MNVITDRSSSLYQQICYVQSVFPNGTVIRGSGSVVGSNDVLTALHVVYDDAYGGWATQVNVIPGAYVNSSSFAAPFGSYAAYSWTGYSNNWDKDGDGVPSAAESSHDLALLNMDVNLGNLVGTLGVSTATNDFYGTLLGYPARGTGLMQDKGASQYHGTDPYSFYYVGTALGPGASGGPMIDTSSGTPLLRGVLSAGDASNYSFSWYAAVTGTNADWLAQMARSNDSLLNEASVYKPSGAGVVNGSGVSDMFYEGRLSYVANHTTVYGYQGLDTLVLGGRFGEYQLQNLAAGVGLDVRDTIAGVSLSLYDVNVLQFTDRTLYLVDPDQAQVARLYTVFGRTPDTQGLNSWLTNHAEGASFDQIASSFYHSQEFFGMYGNFSNQAYAAALYTMVLGRQADGNGLAFWTQQLDSGMGRDQVMVQFTNSAENIDRTQGNTGFLHLLDNNAWTSSDIVIQPGLILGSNQSEHLKESAIVLDDKLSSQVFGYGGGDTLTLSHSSTLYSRSLASGDANTVVLANTDTGENLYLHDINQLVFTDRNVFLLTSEQAQVARLYSTLDRQADFNGLQHWLLEHKDGASLSSIANAFMQSPEFIAHNSASDNRAFVDQLYHTIFDRGADQQGLASWTVQLDHGLSRADLVLALCESVENQDLTSGNQGYIQLVGQSDWV
ncbi:DUF4214 domain-containing protein [Pseudomonas oryzihabitans]|uniref:DUF4214 domain-containing protein n=1 Tax=Pseudomonas oryzihabitans TaxID=47885 RepID=UPI0011A6DCFD|nr:DUF4214 domain-containing protein [Pseudomonas oryzihabitans]